MLHCIVVYSPSFTLILTGTSIFSRTKTEEMRTSQQITTSETTSIVTGQGKTFVAHLFKEITSARSYLKITKVEPCLAISVRVSIRVYLLPSVFCNDNCGTILEITLLYKQSPSILLIFGD